ncbi:MAG: DUF6152 family protein [Gammaproteobacteria bacterium]
MRLGGLAATALVAFILSPARGHHSEAGFDVDAVVAFAGTVTEFSWRNPHVYIRMEAIDAAGNVVDWEVETGATPIMRRSGWTPESLSRGDVISVRGHPERSTGRNYVLLLSLEKADGTGLAQISGDPQSTASATSLAGVWKGRGATVGDFYDRLDEVPLTDAGAAAKAAYDFYVDSPAARCVGPTSPAIVAVGLYVNEIELGDETILIRSEFFDSDRTVYMDGRGHPDAGERTAQGHSIGRWEGDVLVVDTVQFADRRSSSISGVPTGPQKHVIERYALSNDGTHIVIDIVLEDPEYLAEPFAGTVVWNYAPEFELYRYDCDAETSRRFRLD